jgi:poly(glycerol-phosphate) alpha-glucosyltransferase
MKVLHISTSLSRRAGGIFEIELAIARNLQPLGIDVAAMGLTDPEWPKDASRWSPVPASVYPTIGPRFFGYAPALLREMLAAKANLAHLHYMWMYPSLAVTQWSSRTGCPYLVTPNGMLEPWALRNSAWKKKLAGFLYERRMLSKAACIQANTGKEAADIRAYGLKNPIAIIPNGVDFASFANFPSRTALESRIPALKGRRWMLFLARIHPKKGLPHLLKAWAKIWKSESGKQKFGDWVLVIGGPDELGHEAEMKRLATELGIESGVLFTGPLHGKEKLAALGGSELFVLPSFSEGFSMAVLEAAAAGLPVMLTPQCNFPELAEAGGAVEVSPDVSGCETGLRQLLALPDPERQAMGQRGKALVGRSYTWPMVADQMLAVYRWLTAGGSPPPCVRLN